MKALASDTFPLSGHRLIEASAGTGKTYTITNLYLRLLLGRGEDVEQPLGVDQILVLTFTVAATEELRSRVRKRIFEARQGFASGEPPADPFLAHLAASSEDPAKDLRLLTAAMQMLDEASIFTIHGFCARVLSDNAFETGTLFDQDLDADRDTLLQMAARDCFRGLILSLPAFERDIALSLWPSPDDLLATLKPFLFRFNLTMLPPYRDVSGDLDTLAADIEKVKHDWLADDIPALIEDAGFRANATCLSRLPLMKEFCESEALVTDLWEYWTPDYMESRLKKAGVMPKHPVLEAVARIHAASDDLLAQVRHNLWHRVAEDVRRHLALYKVELAQLTLDDLLIKVHDAVTHPATGDMLSRELAARWPVAMIDEFQDTDDIQYDIFSRIYRDAGALFFIGDPKQAIYQFRGADVFTYINAKRGVDEATDIFSLATNYRSTAPLVEAVNTLFDQPNIFDNAVDIPFARVEPAPGANRKGLTEQNDGARPMSITVIAGESSQLAKPDARVLAMSWAAEETVRLLNGAARGAVAIDGEPLRAGQIAFLVRDRHDARAAREALAARGIGSVYVTLESVFLTETADDLKVILQAVIDHTNERAIRAALASPLMQSTASEIAALAANVTVQQQVYKEFADYHALWTRMDVAPMIESLVIRRGIARKWFGRPDGERQITNLRHLAELLQRRSAAAPGMHRLLKWFTREKLAAETVAAEERQLRLESDRDLVQVVTMHAAKGLEYDVVMIPMAAFASQERPNEPCLFHEAAQGEFHTLLEVGDDADHRATAGREKLAEDMRLLYVGVTRAKFKCYLGVPCTRELARSALARLLQIESATDDIATALRARLPASLFDVSTVATTGQGRYEPPGGAAPLIAPAAPPRVRDAWRVHSYTGVSRLMRAIDGGAAMTAEPPGFGDDEQQTLLNAGPRFSRFSFPRGPRAGVALHTLLEALDFRRPVPEQEIHVTACLDRVGITRNRPQWTAVLTDWMSEILTTPLRGEMRLADIATRRRLDEMEFHFPLATDNRLVDLLKAHGYLEPHASLSRMQLTGIMTGLIDLVFEHDGRYWLVDYKSNHLGDTAGDYGAARLAEAMRAHQYDLQYLIYCVALNRYLALRLPHFDYERDFGGVCYLFLRGMTHAGGGVHFDKPAPGLIRELDAVLSEAS